VGEAHSVVPASELEPWDGTVAWLATAGIRVPAERPASRLPTLGEVRAALTALQCSTIEAPARVRDSGLDIDITRDDGNQRATLWVHRAENTGAPFGDQTPVSIHFKRGDAALATSIVRRLAETCGPFLLIVNGDQPRFLR